MSPSLVDLLSKILVVDPSQRIGMEGIMEHPWFVETIEEPIKKVELENAFQSTRIDFKIIYTIIQTLKELDPTKIVKALLQNKHNSLTATYHLLCEK